jgi:SAM-dependent methyltransferase
MATAAKEFPGPDPLLDLEIGAWRGAILRAALELDVWGKIAAGARSAEAMGRAEGWDEDGTRRLLDALCGMRLLAKEAAGYRSTPLAASYLEPGAASLAGFLKAALASWEAPGGSALAGAIRTGRRPLSEDWTAGAMSGAWAGWLGPARGAPECELDAIDALWGKLGIEPRDGPRILDLACGSAVKTLSLARRNVGIRVSLQDHASVLAAAAEIAARLGVGEQIELIPGDVKTASLGAGRFDLAWVGHILHYFGPEDVVEILRRVREALSPGGIAFIHEDVADEGRAEGEYALLESLWLYVVTAKGGTYTLSELRTFLERAGFTDVEPACEEGTGLVIRARPGKDEPTACPATA